MTGEPIHARAGRSHSQAPRPYDYPLPPRGSANAHKGHPRRCSMCCPGAVEKGIFVQAAGHHEEVFRAYHESAPPNAWLATLWNRVARTEIELNTIVGSGLGDAGEHALRAASRMLRLATWTEAAREGSGAEGRRASRAFRSRKLALTDARQRFEDVRKQLAVGGYHGCDPMSELPPMGQPDELVTGLLSGSHLG